MEHGSCQQPNIKPGTKDFTIVLSVLLGKIELFWAGALHPGWRAHRPLTNCFPFTSCYPSLPCEILPVPHPQQKCNSLKLLAQTPASLTKFGFLLIYIHVGQMFVLCICEYRLQGIQFPFLPLWVRSVYWLCRTMAASCKWWMSRTSPVLEEVGLQRAMGVQVYLATFSYIYIIGV